MNLLSPAPEHETEYEGRDISEMKICYDYVTDQYMVRHRCQECGMLLGLRGYDFLDEAIDACDNAVWRCRT